MFESSPMPAAELLAPAHQFPGASGVRQVGYPDGLPDEPCAGPRQYATLYARGSTASLAAIADYVLCVARRAGVGESAGARLRLAVEELAVNAIVHGYRAHCGWLVLIGSSDGRGSAAMQLRDTAPPFDPSAAPEPEGLDLPWRERPVGGLGIRLALSSVEHYRYRRVNDENRSTLIVRRRGQET
ncbi:MAG TPA: ATP-binding protein [Actinospica sp.]|nr:ATP-binding protein [Actinospica sp.]